MSKHNGSVPEIPTGSDWLFYARDSGHERQAASCDQQLTAGQLLLAQAGARLARAPYVDRARKGGSMVGRAELERLLAEAVPGAAYGVMFWSSARMARDVNDAQLIRATLRSRGYVLYFIADNIPNLGEWTILAEVVQDIANAKRRQEISDEAKRGHDLAIKEGLIPHGMPPRGYTFESVIYRTDRDGNQRQAPRWLKDPALEARVRRAWEMRIAGYGLMAINQETRLYPDARHLSRMFRNATYKGVVGFGGRNLSVEPYVTEEEWEAAQAVSRARADRHPRELGSRYLLASLIYCAVCGARMTGHYGHTTTTHKGVTRDYQYRYYACNSRYTEAGFCGARMVRCDVVEARVLEAIEQTYLDEGELAHQYAQWQGALSQTGDRDSELAELEGNVADLRRRIARLLDEVERGASVGERLEQREAELTDWLEKLDRIRAAPVQKLAPPSEVRGLIDRIRAAMEQGDRETARLFLATLVLRVDAHKEQAPRVTLRPPIIT